MVKVYTDNTETPVIEVAFPEEKYFRYLEKLPLRESGIPTTQQKKHIFITMIFDFQKGNISLDELSSIANYLWSELSDNEKESDEFADVLYAASELIFYIRQINETPQTAQSFVNWMNDIMRYYNKNKAYRLK